MVGTIVRCREQGQKGVKGRRVDASKKGKQVIEQRDQSAGVRDDVMHAQKQRSVCRKRENLCIKQGVRIKWNRLARLCIKIILRGRLVDKGYTPARKRRISGIVLHRAVIGLDNAQAQNFGLLHQTIECMVYLFGCDLVECQQNTFGKQCFVWTMFGGQPDLHLRLAESKEGGLRLHGRLLLV